MISNEELCVMAQSGNEDAANQLFLQNENYIHGLCHKYSNLGEHDELFGILQIGFVKAMQSFKFVKGNKFLTYASYVLNNEVLMASRSGNQKKRKMKLTSIYTEVIYTNQRDEVLLIDFLQSQDKSLEELMVQRENRSEFYKYLNVVIKTELERTVMRLYLRGKKQSEVAKMVGASRLMVSRIIARITERVQKKLNAANRITA